MEKIARQIQETQDQKRIFGAILSDVQDSSLFFQDKSGNTNVKLAKLKIDEILNSKSKLSVPLSRLRKNSFKVLENGKKISKIFEKQVKKTSVYRKPFEKTIDLQDPWNDTKVSPILIASSFNSKSYLEPVQKVKKPELPLPPPLAQVSQEVTVEISHPGSSYNPKKSDHDSLIQLAYQEEIGKISQKIKIEEKLNYSKELLDLDDDMTKELEHSSSGEEEIKDSKEIHGKFKKRKTRADRNKELKEKSKIRQRLSDIKEKKLNKDINLIKEIEKQLHYKKEKSNFVKDSSKSILGPYKFRKMSMEIQLSDEISENLRKFKPEGNLFKDRFQAFQKKQMIETRFPVSTKRRYRLKETESHDYKRFK